MWRISKLSKIFIMIFAGWFIGVPIYGGYALLNDADFLATLPQFENPDIDGFFLIVLKKQLFLIIPTLTPIFLPIGCQAFRSFSQALSLRRDQPDPPLLKSIFGIGVSFLLFEIFQQHKFKEFPRKEKI